MQVAQCPSQNNNVSKINYPVLYSILNWIYVQIGYSMIGYNVTGLQLNVFRCGNNPV